jgi:dihydrofolate reductase
MRTVTYGAACSLDGFITDREGGVGWLHFSDDAQQVMAEYWAGVDTILMGRKTWEVAMRQRGDTSPEAAEGDSGMGGMSSYLFSRTLRESPPDGIELVSDDAAGFVNALKERPGKGICVLGGGELGSALIEAGVVDEVGVNIHPILLGSGVPLFRDTGQVKLTLVESRVMAGGCVYARYAVIKDSGISQSAPTSAPDRDTR